MPASTPRWSTPSIVAPWPGRRPTLGLAAAIVASVLTGAAMADPLSLSSTVASSARAGGMLQGPSAAPYAVYSATFGIERGTCDRRQVARDLARRDDGRQPDDRQIAAAGGPMGGLAVGREMDAVDLGCVSRVLEYASDRQTIRWYGMNRSGRDGAAYAFTPLATFERQGLFCRDYRAIASRDGQDRQGYGTACRQADGLWRSGD